MFINVLMFTSTLVLVIFILSNLCHVFNMQFVLYPPPNILDIKSFIFLPVHHSIVPPTFPSTLTVFLFLKLTQYIFALWCFPLVFSTFFDVSQAYVIFKTGRICKQKTFLTSFCLKIADFLYRRYVITN